MRSVRHSLPTRALLSVGLVAGCAGLALSAAAPAAAAPGYTEYVSFGDSFVAGASIVPAPVTDQAPAGCFQRGDNYPRQVAAALSIPVHRDASCSGATTAHLTTSQNTGLGTNNPQFDRLTATTDLVTIGFGANDINFGGEIPNCISLLSFPSPACATAATRLKGKIPGFESTFTAALREIHLRAPNAQIFVVSMLQIFPPTGCWPLVPIANADVTRLNGVLNDLAAALGRSAAAAGAHFVDINAMSGGHDICKGVTTRWVEGIWFISLNGGATLQTPGHPNTAGTNAQASFVTAAVSGVAPLAVATTTTPTTTTTTSPPASTTAPPTTVPVTAAPTSTAPPATEPPTTVVVTEPPTTAPPATEPPTTAPPVTEPPTTVAVTEPPATEPPTTTTA